MSDTALFSDANIDAIHVNAYAARLVQDGFSTVSSKIYDTNASFNQFEMLTNAQLDYYRISADPHGGGRYRAFSRYRLTPGSTTPVLDDTNDYVQSPEYNYDDGGLVRKFAPLSQDFRNNSLIQHLIQKDLEIARATDLVDWSSNVIIGLHQIRYHAKPDAPSISSPIWLHRDDEPVVFIHLFNLSASALGGDNLISTGNRSISRVIRLTSPLESVVLGKKVLHAVTPVGTNSSTGAYRDILLITFSNEESK
ncbi:2OG-Fe dioxygenase family protein [Chitinimonas sp. PSY-7]|uniref:2OG-Fe dioxygenase family protein n=1 Tax=Chitinimonas sp. PSY-7 TaxID=3459088 RepID=UPI00403FCEEE